MRNTNRTKIREFTPEGTPVPSPLVTPFLLLLNDTNIIGCENRAGHQYA